MNSVVHPTTGAPTSSKIIGRPVRRLAEMSDFRLLLFIAVHIPLALVIRQSALLATAHALIVLLIGLAWVAQGKPAEYIGYLVAYIMGAELLWRGTKAYVFYEFAKYAISLIMVLALLRNRQLVTADKRLLPYFFLLLPSITVLPEFDREQISFHLSGPLLLAVSAMFFSTLRLNRMQTKRMLTIGLAPIVGLAAIALRSTLSVDQIHFSDESNFVTSGGIGPNQVSSLLGLGALMALWLVVLEHDNAFFKVMMGGCVLWLATQAALTLSRGGLWTTLGAMAIAMFYLLRDQRTRLTFVVGGVVLVLIGYYGVFPLLDNFTGGTLSRRFSDFDPTGRDQIAQADLLVFRDNFWLGVGPGQSTESRFAYLLEYDIAHTEYTRLLSEHGIFGAVGLLILFGVTMQRLIQPADGREKGFVISFTAWALIYMIHAAMRLAAPGFLFGLGTAELSLGSETDE